MADVSAAAKEQLAKSNEEKRKAVEESDKYQGRPTPTQEENDLARLGVPFDQHSDDGSGPEPKIAVTITRQAEAGKPGASYSTRSAAAQSGRSSGSSSS